MRSNIDSHCSELDNLSTKIKLSFQSLFAIFFIEKHLRITVEGIHG